ncbi:MAG: DUF1385 domain-containing protein [Oscillospiraceae bacterium]
MNSNNHFKTSIGGSALIEGVMMRGPDTTAMAVRKSDGTVDLSTWETNPNGKKKPWYKTTPLVRGIFNFVDSMVVSYKCLMKSADLSDLDETENEIGFEKWLHDKLGDRFGKAIGMMAMALGIVLAIGLFMVLPTVIISLLKPMFTAKWLLSLVEAVVKIGIFVAYLFAVSRTPDIRRVFEYHGAEHKTIACYEAGEALTAQNIAKFSRFHPRCGTSFILIVLIVSVLVFSWVTWSSVLMRIMLKLICLPLVVGIAYEIIKLSGRYDNLITRIVSAPGLWLQRLTTREPDDQQIEVAIASMEPCIPQADGADRW